MMKLVIPNQDINDPSETREIVAVEFDLGDVSEAGAPPPDLAGSIAKAAADAADTLRKNQLQAQRREVQAQAEREFKAIADRIKAETGVAIGYDRPWAYQPKSKAAYGLWKRVVTMFVEHPATLDIKPTALAARLNASEPNYVVTRDMMYDRLNTLAERDLVRLLGKLGITLKLRRPVHIRNIQKQLAERRDAAKGLEVEEFTGHVSIRGDKALVNGKPYAIQLNASGKRRIKRGVGQWLPLDTLKAFCAEAE